MSLDRIFYSSYDNDGTARHEGFHIFQYESNSPGFDYSGDSQWYIESSAQWYAATFEPRDRGMCVECGAVFANPQLALWHSFNNHVRSFLRQMQWKLVPQID